MNEKSENKAETKRARKRKKRTHLDLNYNHDRSIDHEDDFCDDDKGNRGVLFTRSKPKFTQSSRSVYCAPPAIGYNNTRTRRGPDGHTTTRLRTADCARSKNPDP
ncbi:hypothetical protein PGTUg99_009455 [Puccinia graminis f. sp. tritici]|uniref:Uncharacterized protein n=1 Tax=Puccinia graminis f. sp. tritici TaxID=56615 RepID=A0A5B0RL09_PUCGR|nr:hypothetical protein PGTUg99_009455 [Puccinia graminis f. sp. tritici]